MLVFPLAVSSTCNQVQPWKLLLHHSWNPVRQIICGHPKNTAATVTQTPNLKYSYSKHLAIIYICTAVCNIALYHCLSNMENKWSKYTWMAISKESIPVNRKELTKETKSGSEKVTKNSKKHDSMREKGTENDFQMLRRK